MQSNAAVVDRFEDKDITVFLKVVNYSHNDTASFPRGTLMIACHEIHCMYISVSKSRSTLSDT